MEDVKHTSICPTDPKAQRWVWIISAVCFPHISLSLLSFSAIFRWFRIVPTENSPLVLNNYYAKAVGHTISQLKVLFILSLALSRMGNKVVVVPYYLKFLIFLILLKLVKSHFKYTQKIFWSFSNLKKK